MIFVGSAVVAGGTPPKVICLPKVGAIGGAVVAPEGAPVVPLPNRFIGDLFSLGLKKDLDLGSAGVEVAPIGTANVISAAVVVAVAAADGLGCLL